MPDSFELLQASFFEHPFLRYADTRYFYPGVKEQRKVLSVASDFIYDNSDPSKNLGVFAGPSGGGKSMLAMKIAQTHYSVPNIGQIFGMYMNTNTLTEPRHFLMALIETLGLPSSRSNANRIESIFERLEEGNDQLLIVLDGPPVDQEYLTQLLEWSVENNKKIKTLIFLQDINNVTSNIGALSQFLGLYVPFRQPTHAELTELLYYRMFAAGNPDPKSVISEDEMSKLIASHGSSIAECLAAATDHLEV
jgi:Cdc6-like AAA superfamily ATPase